jgi:hypothetical protein
MRLPRWISALPVLGGALVLMLLPAGCSDDDSPTGTGGGGTGGTATIPASWGGTWQITSTPAPAPGPFRGSSADASIVPLCAGLPVDELMGTPDGFPDLDMTCTGTWTDQAVDVTCTGSYEVEGCTFSFSSTLRLNRNGETFSGTQSVTFSTSGTCGTTEETTTDDLEGIRLDTSQFGCGTNLDRAVPASWGGTWSIVETPGRGGGSEVLMCPDWDIEDIFFEGQSADAVGGFTDTVAQVFGSSTSPAGDCLEIRTQQFDLVRSGDTITGTHTTTIYTVEDPSGTGGSGCTGEVTETFDVAGTRTSTDVSGCTPFVNVRSLSEASADDFRLLGTR